MFTGLVERVGSVASIEPRGEGLRLSIATPGWASEIAIGDSIAVNGCCLTAVEAREERFASDVVPETARRTALGQLRPGDAVNLERALRLDQRLGGHVVQGHVDGLGHVVSVRPEQPGKRIEFEAPEALARFVAEKGSIAIDGVSLTVAACAGSRFEVAFVPHTLAATVAGRYAAGSAVHLEVDVLARYVARWLETAGEER
jgi:riboflavin synthase